MRKEQSPPMLATLLSAVNSTLSGLTPPTGGKNEEGVLIIDDTASALRLSELRLHPLDSYR